MNIRFKQQAFTLIEIVVATTLFAFVATAMMSLFNYTLKINRRAEAVRQATQGVRNFVEQVTKEIRNGEIDYGLNSSHDAPRGSAIGACGNGVLGSDYYGSAGTNYKDNKLSIVNNEGKKVCLYFADNTGAYLGSGIFRTSGGGVLVLEKEGLTSQILNPKNFYVSEAMFLVRPTCDPYTPKPPSGPGCTSYSSDYPKIQPSVSMSLKFLVVLPTGETKDIYYQTTVSVNKYDVPK